MPAPCLHFLKMTDFFLRHSISYILSRPVLVVRFSPDVERSGGGVGRSGRCCSSSGGPVYCNLEWCCGWAGEKWKADALRMSRRPSYSDMASNFQVLRVELERCFGDSRRVPSSTELRALKRTDLEKVRVRILAAVPSATFSTLSKQAVLLSKA